MVKKIFFPLEVFYPSQAGGPANSIYWVTKNLLKHDFKPTIISTDKGLQPKVPVNKWIESDGGKVIYIKTKSLNFPFHQIILALANFSKSDVVHLSSFFFPTSFVTAFAARLLRKKIVWSARGELDTAALNHSRMRKLPILWCLKKIFKKYPTFHSTCREETEYIRMVFGDRARVAEIPNYIEIPDKAARNSGKYILYIGRIHPKKAIDNLIKAVLMSEEFMNSDFVLKIAGTGKKEFENDLRELVDKLGLNQKVIFVGQVEGIEKQKILADAFWTIMPSHTENFGIVVLESLAQSTPVIASKGSPWASLEDEQIGFWTENSPEMLASKIDDVFKMPDSEYEKYRSRCRGFVEREFDIQKNIGRWVDLYESL